MARKKRPGPVFLRTPFPTFEQVRKEMGVSQKRAAWIKKLVRETIFENICKKYRISKEDAALIGKIFKKERA